MKVTAKQIRALHAKASRDGDVKLLTLCEIALGGNGPLNQIARDAVSRQIAGDS